MILICYVRSPQTIPTGRTHGTQHLVALKAKTYNRIHRAEGGQEEFGGMHVQASLCLLPLTRGCTELCPPQQQGCDNICNIPAWGSPLETQSQGFYCVWSRRHPLPSMGQGSGHPEGKQVFSINHTVCTGSVCAVSHSWQLGTCGNPPEIWAPSCLRKTSFASGIAVSGLPWWPLSACPVIFSSYQIIII